MFSRSLYPSFYSPFSRSSWFDDDPFFDEWNELLNRQYQQQLALRQKLQQQQPTRRIQPKDSQQSSSSSEQQVPSSSPSTTEQKQSCDPSCNKECNTTNCATTCGTQCQTNCNKDKQVASAPSSGNGTVAPARSFWDLASFPSWSGLTSQNIRLEWSGTEPSAKEYVVSAYLPDGVTPADVSISMDERTRMLTLKCQCQTKSHEEEKDKDGHVISSRSSSSFSQRSLQLPQDVDINAISASKNQSTGANSPQLVLHLPKLAAPAPQPGVKQIAIN